MSIKINVDDLSYEAKESINDDLELCIESKYGPSKYIQSYSLKNNKIAIPFSYATNKLGLKRPIRSDFTSKKVKFNGELRDKQKIVKKEAISLLNKTGRVLLSMYCGFGKTATAINLSCTIGLPTVVIVKGLTLLSQWKDSIQKFCKDASVQIIYPKTKVLEICDFYIINATNVLKMEEGFFSRVGLVIVDEAHLIVAENLVKSLECIHPRYLIGLTATPYRPDGLTILLDFYFGVEKIIRKLYRKHDVIILKTNFKPQVEYAKNGKVNWGSILNSQADDKDRNELIIDTVKRFKNKVFLILVKRISQGEYLLDRLQQEKEDVTSLMGKSKVFDHDARILIGTSSKLGVGFDHPRLNSLIVAADLEEYFIQYLGRVFRTEEGTPLIIDFEDNNPILKKHLLTRKSVYREHGGKMVLGKI